MPFPNSQVAIALIDVYLQTKEKDWNSYKESAAWLYKTVTFSKHKGKEAKVEECVELKKRLQAEKNEFDKWIELCIYLGEKATAELEERSGKASLLVSYMHLLRTYILSKLNQDDTKNLLEAYKQPLKKIALSDKNSNSESKEKTASQKLTPEEINASILKLAYLGDDEAISDACKKNLLKYYTMEDSWPVCFDDNYYKSSFYDTEVKPHIHLTPTFEEFETSILPKAEPKKANVIESGPVAPETVAALNLVRSGSPEVVTAEEFEASLAAQQRNEAEPTKEKQKTEEIMAIPTPELPLAEVKAEVLAEQKPETQISVTDTVSKEVEKQPLTALPVAEEKTVTETELKAQNTTSDIPSATDLPDAAPIDAAKKEQVIDTPEARKDGLPRLHIPAPTLLPEITAPEKRIEKEEQEPSNPERLPEVIVVRKMRIQDKSALTTNSPSKSMFMATRFTISPIIGPSQLGLLAKPTVAPVEDYRTRLRDRSTIKPRKWV